MTHTTPLNLAACISLLVTFADGAHAQRPPPAFVLIVNDSNPVVSLSAESVSKLFLRKRTTWPNGRKVQPVDLVMSSPTRREFSDAVHGMDVPSVKGYWQELVFSGRGEPPPERASDADVVAFVRGNANAFGYVSLAAPRSGVKVLTLERGSR